MVFKVAYEWEIPKEEEVFESITSEIFSPVFSASPDENTHFWRLSLKLESLNRYRLYIHLRDEPFHTKVSVDSSAELIGNNDRTVLNITSPSCILKANRSICFLRTFYDVQNFNAFRVTLKLSRPENIKTDKKLQYEKISYEWKINNQNELSEEETFEIFSTVFSGSPDEIGHLWRISLQWDSEASTFYGIYISLEDEPFHTKIKMYFSIEVIDDEDTIIAEEPFSDSYLFEETKKKYGFKNAIDGNDYNIKNIKAIKVELKLIRPKEINIGNIRRVHVCEDLLKLYQNQDFTDVTIFCKNHEFQVHKQILAARSPVFYKKFIRENISHEIIKNVSPKSVKIFIMFLYSGSVHIPCKLLEDIMLLSVQYSIDDLKKYCIQEMKRQLSIETAIPILMMADKYELSIAKTKALIFFKENIKEIMETERFKKTKQEVVCKAFEWLALFR